MRISDFSARTFWVCVLGLAACQPAQTAEPPSQPELAWEVYGVFHRHCVDCHGGHRAKPKGKFGHVLDLERLSGDEKYLVPGEPDNSEIYLLLTDPDPDFRMPPEDSDAPPVSENDIGLVRAWIEGGARMGWSNRESTAAAPGIEAEAAPVPGGNPLRIVGRMHPLVVHFPIALLLVALGAELVGAREAARGCLWIGALGALGSAGSGWLFAGVEGYAPDTVFRHRWLGVTTALLALTSAVLLECAVRAPGRGPARLARILLLLVAALVGLAGHTGGVLVHGEGFPW